MTRLERLVRVYERRYLTRGTPAPLTLLFAMECEGVLISALEETH